MLVMLEDIGMVEFDVRDFTWNFALHRFRQAQMQWVATERRAVLTRENPVLTCIAPA